MTIKQLTNLNPDELEALSDEQLMAYLKPYIKVIEVNQSVSDGIVDLTTVSNNKPKESKSDIIAKLEALIKSKVG